MVLITESLSPLETEVMRALVHMGWPEDQDGWTFTDIGSWLYNNGKNFGPNHLRIALEELMGRELVSSTSLGCWKFTSHGLELAKAVT